MAVSGPRRHILALSSAAFAVLALTGCATPAAEQAPAPPALQTRTSASSPEYFVYQVQKGDTLYSLGRGFGVPWREIAEDNDITSPGRLTVGAPLLIRRVAGAQSADQPAPPDRAERPVQRREVTPQDLHRGRTDSRFWWPTAGRLVRRYREQFRGFPEPGIAIAAPAGTDVCAVADGQVVTLVLAGANPQSVWGNVIFVAHAGDMVSSYAHLHEVFVEKGDRVDRGQPIGTVGASGAAPEPMLAFRLFRDELLVDPTDYLP